MFGAAPVHVLRGQSAPQAMTMQSKRRKKTKPNEMNCKLNAIAGLCVFRLAVGCAGGSGMADDKSSAFAFLLLICLCIDVTQSVIIVFFSPPFYFYVPLC